MFCVHQLLPSRKASRQKQQHRSLSLPLLPPACCCRTLSLRWASRGGAPPPLEAHLSSLFLAATALLACLAACPLTISAAAYQPAGRDGAPSQRFLLYLAACSSCPSLPACPLFFLRPRALCFQLAAVLVRLLSLLPCTLSSRIIGMYTTRQGLCNSLPKQHHIKGWRGCRMGGVPDEHRSLYFAGGSQCSGQHEV